MEYFVKWKELPHNESTWETSEELKDFPEAVRKFDSSQKSKKSPKKTKPSDPTARKFKELKEQPSYLSCTLYPFQLDGINWLRYTWASSKNVILADEV